MQRFVSSKWLKTKALLTNNELQKYVPRTELMTASSLMAMLHELKMVYIKPNIGSYGNGVMRVEWNPTAIKVKCYTMSRQFF